MPQAALLPVIRSLLSKTERATENGQKKNEGLSLEVNRSLVRQSPFFAFLLDITVYPDKMIMNFIFICYFMENS